MISAALAVSDLADTLPPELLRGLKLPAFRDCINLLHHPPNAAEQVRLQDRSHPAWRRIKFDELLAQQLSMRIHYDRRRMASAPALQPRGDLTRALLERLPFQLTRAQVKAAAEIRKDLARPHPMQRLLQGDVGSGKTIVAALAACRQSRMASGRDHGADRDSGRAALHQVFGLAWRTGRQVAWLWAASRKQKREALAQVATGEAQIAIGTHALFQDEVEFKNLGVAIVDEQHRFGVRQRLALRLKGTHAGSQAQPHQLMMSATPIPRTLAMSYYADLDVSVLDEMPPGRTAVATRLVSDTRRDEVISACATRCIAGSQAYGLSIDQESEALQLQTALDTYQRWWRPFPNSKWVCCTEGSLPPRNRR
jgi:ATP-dependent DNA helicase RecG